MDWLDSYLDALSDGKSYNFPPDKITWNKPIPNQSQKKIIFDSIASSEAEKRLLFEQRALELFKLENESGGSYFAGDVNLTIQELTVSSNGEIIELLPSATVLQVVVSDSVTSFTLQGNGFSFDVQNNFDVNNFNNCNLLAFNLVNVTVDDNQIYVGESATLTTSQNINYTWFYTGTGSAIFTLNKTDSAPPAPIVGAFAVATRA